MYRISTVLRMASRGRLCVRYIPKKLVVHSALPWRGFASSSDDADDPDVQEDKNDPIVQIVDSKFGPSNFVKSSSKVSSGRKDLAVVGNVIPDFPTVVPICFSGTPILPVPAGLPFPHIMLLQINDPNMRSIIDALRKANVGYFGLFLHKDEAINHSLKEGGKRKKKSGSAEVEDEDMVEEMNKSMVSFQVSPDIRTGKWKQVSSLEEMHPTGLLCSLGSLSRLPLPDGLYAFVAHRRIGIQSLERESPVPLVRIKHFHDSIDARASEEERNLINANVMHLQNLLLETLSMRSPVNINTRIIRDILSFISSEALADVAAASSPNASAADLQDILDTLNLKSRLFKATLIVKKELEVLKMRQVIGNEVDKKFRDRHEHHMKMEQFNILKKELGLERDEKAEIISKYHNRLESLKINDDVQKVIHDEIEKLQHLEPSSAEFNVTRNYLDWLTVLPWGIFSSENLDVLNAEKILNEDHYGLEDIKDRILEFIAVGKLLGAAPQGRIICFTGPPGVGKTSIGKSIARALDRQFFRFSVGGLTDVAEIKGHRRTYIGAMPGKLIQALKSVKTSNPVILIDEIDKLGKSYQGDPASALLEVLDPEQNGMFTDHYLDIPFDLSKVLFICTANMEDTIPGPLADRMEFIRLSGYIMKEKVEIAKNYLSPHAAKSSGFKEDQVVINEDALENLIKSYCREAGVRSLEKEIQKIYRKLALKVVRMKEEEVPAQLVVDSDSLETYVGKPKFISDRLYDVPPPGVVCGLAWTSMGGSTLYIESMTNTRAGDGNEEESKGKGSVLVTGLLGEVMQESSKIAMSVAKQFMNRIDSSNKVLDVSDIHLHCPSGAIPKDGPSAGITMVTSFLSLAMNEKVKPNLAMTGELTLTGMVMPIGGVREKTIAAKRSGITELIFPFDNRRDFDELPDHVKEGITPHFVKSYDQVFKIAFPDHQ